MLISGVFDVFLKAKLYLPFEIIFEELISAFSNVNKCQIHNIGKKICFLEKWHRAEILGVINLLFCVFSSFSLWLKTNNSQKQILVGITWANFFIIISKWIKNAPFEFLFGIFTSCILWILDLPFKTEARKYVFFNKWRKIVNFITWTDSGGHRSEWLKRWETFDTISHSSTYPNWFSIIGDVSFFILFYKLYGWTSILRGEV